MGVCLVSKAAAFENRLAACLADDGVLSIHKTIIDKLSMIADDIKNGNE